MKYLTVLFLSAIFLTTEALPLHAQTALSATVKLVQGKVEVRQEGIRGWSLLKKAGLRLPERAQVRTGKDGALLIWLDEKGQYGKISVIGKGLLRIAVLKQTAAGREIVLELGRGRYIVNANPDVKDLKFEIVTPTGRLAVKDAAMSVTVE